MIPATKKGAELALNVIIIAAIGLLVLIVLAFIFAGKTQIFSKSADSCSSKQGSCIPSSDVCIGPVVPAGDCREGEKCCVKI